MKWNDHLACDRVLKFVPVRAHYWSVPVTVELMQEEVPDFAPWQSIWQVARE
jgi:hypothetical protein